MEVCSQGLDHCIAHPAQVLVAFAVFVPLGVVDYTPIADP